MSFTGAWSAPVVAEALGEYVYPWSNPRTAYALARFEKPWSAPVLARYSVAVRLVDGEWRPVVLESFR